METISHYLMAYVDAGSSISRKEHTSRQFFVVSLFLLMMTTLIAHFYLSAMYLVEFLHGFGLSKLVWSAIVVAPFFYWTNDGVRYSLFGFQAERIIGCILGFVFPIQMFVDGQYDFGVLSIVTLLFYTTSQFSCVPPPEREVTLRGAA